MDKTDSVILSADIGTSALKVALINGRGLVSAFSQQTYSSNSGYTMSGEWQEALYRAAGEFGTQMQNVCAICISGNGPTIVADDGSTLLWNTDVSMERESQQLQACKTESLFIPRILAFKKCFPSIWNSGMMLFSGPEYLIRRLTGHAVTILPELRYRKAYWDSETLAEYAISESRLPKFVNPGYNAGLTLPDITDLLGLQLPIPVFCGAPDFLAALIGTNTLKNGTLCDCAGSSEGLNLCTDRPICAKNIRTLPSILPGLWNAAILFPESGKLFSDYKKHVEAVEGISISYKKLITRSLRKPDSEGYHLLYGLAEKVRSGLEYLLEEAAKAGMSVAPVMSITGGQAKNSEWVQMKATCIGYPIAVTDCTDAELTGDAIIAWTGLGRFKSVNEAADQLVHTATVYSPRS